MISEKTDKIRSRASQSFPRISDIVAFISKPQTFHWEKKLISFLSKDGL